MKMEMLRNKFRIMNSFASELERWLETVKTKTKDADLSIGMITRFMKIDDAIIGRSLDEGAMSTVFSDDTAALFCMQP